MFERRAFLAVAASAAALPRRLLAQSSEVLTPEQFGARGNGRTDDTRAFAALSADLNKRGGGTVALAKGRTYQVGEQHQLGEQWVPSPILDLKNLSKPLLIIGNGARLRAKAGLRFGTFDPATGEPLHVAMPSYGMRGIAIPYKAMISVERSTAPVEIRNVELDGNADQMWVGGQHGDTGWQIPAVGLLLAGNRSTETIINVLSHHHAQDGAIIVGDPERQQRSRIQHYAGRYNARQALSLTAGRGYDFYDCEFSHTGRGKIRSAPSAGVDIEAEEAPIRDVTFVRCRFVDNAGVGMVADSGDSELASFKDCLFVGTTAWSAWPKKPRFSFDHCTFVGSIVHAFSDPHASRATRFVNCRFTDDPKLSPTGVVYTPSGAIANLAVSDNVLFDHCRFELVGSGALPWSWRAIYRDCLMSQRAPQQAMPKGRYLGRTVINAPVDLYGSMIQGDVIVNGRALARGPQGVKPW